MREAMHSIRHETVLRCLFWEGDMAWSVTDGSEVSESHSRNMPDLLATLYCYCRNVLPLLCLWCAVGRVVFVFATVLSMAMFVVQKCIDPVE